MPTYIYQHPKTKATKEVIQRMTEAHVYIDEAGTEWKRVFTVPNASIDTNINAFSHRDFVEKTGKKRGTFGDLFDQSREASEKRRKVLGKDPVKEKSLKDWGEKRQNRTHPLLKAVSEGNA